MRTAISNEQWQPRTAVSPLLGLISMAKPAVSDRGKPVYFFVFGGPGGPVRCPKTMKTKGTKRSDKNKNKQDVMERELRRRSCGINGNCGGIVRNDIL